MALKVAMWGCPYTIGMAEPIRTDDALMFSEAFYGELFNIVRTTLAGGGAAAAPQLLDLSPAVIPARKAIHACATRSPIPSDAGCFRSSTSGFSSRCSCRPSMMR
jgi:hypothetical protein